MRALGKVFTAAFLLGMLAAAACAADRVPVTFAGFSFAGRADELAGLYPYSSRLAYETDPAASDAASVTLKRNDNPALQSFYAIGAEGAAFYAALREAHYRIVEPLTRFELKRRVESDEVDSFHRYGLTTALVHESVHTVPVPDYNRQTRRWEDGKGAMAFFKLAFLVLILDYRDNSLRDAVPFTCIGKKYYAAAPTDGELLDEVRKLYLGAAGGENGEEGLVTRQLARSLSRVSLDDSAGKTLQVSGVSFGEDARAALGELLERHKGADYFVGVELSARLASLLNARVMPPLYDNSINQIVLQHPDVEARAYAVPRGEYRLEMEIASFGNAVAERTTSAGAYALSAAVRLGMTRGESGGEWTEDAAVSLGKTRPVPKAMAENWPFGVSYFDALPALCRGVAEHMGEVRPTAGWEF